MDSTTIRFNKVDFRYKHGPWLFKNFDLVLATHNGKGRIVALMGPSGIGKSTFCDLALGSQLPLAGTIDRIPSTGVGLIPQRAVLFEELDVIENINCLRYSHSLGPTFRQERFNAVVQSLGLKDVIKRNESIAKLSGGEAQRVMLARIGMVDCRILVLDEPCSFLDNRVKETFLNSLRMTVDQFGLLTMIVTHIWDEAAFVADEIITFHHEDGIPITISRNIVSEAFLTPPTIDAMYAIHWPKCMLLCVEDVRRQFPDLSIAPSVSSVGLFDTGCVTSNIAPWAPALWQSNYSNSTVARSGRMLWQQSAHFSTVSISAAAYTNEGRLISAAFDSR